MEQNSGCVDDGDVTGSLGGTHDLPCQGMGVHREAPSDVVSCLVEGGPHGLDHQGSRKRALDLVDEGIDLRQVAVRIGLCHWLESAMLSDTGS